MGPEPLIRPMRDADADAVARIQSAAGEASQWDPRGYLPFESTVLELDGHVAAFLVIRQTAPDEAEILNLAVDPAHRRRGLARKLLAAAFRAPRTFFLEVRESNASAQALYRSLGFTECGRRPGYYRQPDEAAILMRRD
ncbi:MAG: ribosomal protein S18-alanine N-acetyltransferase [Bryobacteraceae bacterium]|nr:ribosomal protein S18-alanine N-acetyltransferase [Bryobacteraceae bacterium]